MDTKTFSEGDKVQWTSQAGGTQRTKQGVIFKVLQPHETPLKYGVASAGKGWGSSRREVSYVVEVQRARSKEYFWPLVKYLTPVEAPHASVSE